MKATDLKFPSSWEERSPALLGRVLFVPKCYDKHDEWQGTKLFENELPVHVEYCSGNGDWILQKALENPAINWIAVEQKFERVRKIWVKSERLALANLRIICGEALTYTTFYPPKKSVDAIYVNFPDPWPKGRHAKHRLIQQPFIEQLSYMIKEKGIATLVTDDPAYCDQICHEMHHSARWKALFPAPFFKTDWDNYGTSYFRSLWQEKGRVIYYMQFENCL